MRSLINCDKLFNVLRKVWINEENRICYKNMLTRPNKSIDEFTREHPELGLDEIDILYLKAQRKSLGSVEF